ncbi:MAG: hypothetical protein LPK85_12590, partial [Gammaproteobacteria bacterium]|nr:hypothetical protein [Gammaproteobacteria bacterium]
MNDIDEQLTLYVNGQLDPDSRARLDARLAEDAALRDEVRFLQALRQGLHDQNVPAPGELGLARLKRSLAEEAGAVPAATRAPSRTFWKPLALAACTILGVQTALLMTSTDPTPTDMQPLSGPA